MADKEKTPTYGRLVFEPEDIELVDRLVRSNRQTVALLLALVVRSINETSLSDVEKAYFKAELMLIAATIGTECLEELQRRVEDNGHNENQ